jgi:hypothetical protein
MRMALLLGNASGFSRQLEYYYSQLIRCYSILLSTRHAGALVQIVLRLSVSVAICCFLTTATVAWKLRNAKKGSKKPTPMPPVMPSVEVVWFDMKRALARGTVRVSRPSALGVCLGLKRSELMSVVHGVV